MGWLALAGADTVGLALGAAGRLLAGAVLADA